MHAQRFIKHLKSILKGKVCILGIGNTMKGDDGAGSFFASKIVGEVSAEVIDAGVAPENFLEKIVQSRPRTIIIVDAVDFNGYPGELRVLRLQDLQAGSISTHALSPDMLKEYLNNRLKADIFLIGIQPYHTGLDTPMSAEVKNAIDSLSSILRDSCPRQ